MLCEDCHENPASVHFTQIVNDETETLHLCQSCAEERGLKTPLPGSQAPLSDFLSEMGAPIFTSATNTNAACPRCGCTFRQFRKTGRLGCSRCYSNEHVGISEDEGVQLPSGPEAQLAALRRELRQAVDNEEYERAAELRDAIVELEADVAVTVSADAQSAVEEVGGGDK
jgi:protein arginine kinase activator